MTSGMIIAFSVFVFLVLVGVDVYRFAFLIGERQVAIRPVRVGFFSGSTSSEFVRGLFSDFLVVFGRGMVSDD